MKYILVQIKMVEGYYSKHYIFDIYATSNSNNTNVSIIDTLELNDEEALNYNNRIAVYENTIACKSNSSDVKYVYRLIPETKFEKNLSTKLNIPESAVVYCNLFNIPENLEKLHKGNLKLIDVHITDINTVIKQELKDEVNLIDFKPQELRYLDKNYGLYYHHIHRMSFPVSHNVLFLNVPLNELLSNNSYTEFEKMYKEKTKDIILAYLYKYYDNNAHYMEDRNAKIFFDEESFYYPGIGIELKNPERERLKRLMM